MSQKTYSIFVDESGRFLHPDGESRFYILGLVLHDQSHDIAPLCASIDQDWADMGLSGHCFHAGPLIRKEKGYAILNREFRARIFARMAAFVRKADVRFRCLVVDKHFVSSSAQIVEELRRKLADFLPGCEAVRQSNILDCGNLFTIQISTPPNSVGLEQKAA